MVILLDIEFTIRSEKRKKYRRLKAKPSIKYPIQYENQKKSFIWCSLTGFISKLNYISNTECSKNTVDFVMQGID